MGERDYNAWAFAHRSDERPDQWIAHVLEFDVVTQGNSLQHTMLMAAEAALIVVLEDLAAKRDPFERRAPESEWDPLWTLLRQPSAKIVTPDSDVAGHGGSESMPCKRLGALTRFARWHSTRKLRLSGSSNRPESPRAPLRDGAAIGIDIG